MPIPGTLPVTGPIAPTATTDTYPSHLAEYGKGGYRTVADNTVRDAIPAGRREEGMLVYSIAVATDYRLGADLLTWTAVTTPGLPSNVMLKDDYDPTDSGSVVDSDALEGQNGAYYLARANHTGTQAQATITNLTADLAAKEDAANKGVNNGYASLDAGGLVPLAQLPIAVAPLYQGLYNATTNTPAILNGVGVAGQFYIANVIGNAYAPVNVTIVNQIVAYDGAVWQVGAVFSGGIASVTTALGVQTGPGVTINTLDYVADSATRKAVSANIAAGLANSPTPITASNPAASITDVYTWFNADIFANGQTLGDGTSRTLASLGYNNGTAAAAWPLVDADPRFTINVNTMTIDWIACQEAALTMESTQQNYMTSTGTRSYVFNQSWQLPRDQLAIALARRSGRFQFDWKSDIISNLTGNDFPLVMRDVPTSQVNATASGYNTYKFKFENMVLRGNRGTTFNNDPTLNDTGILLPCTIDSEFISIKAFSFMTGFDLIFSLNPNFLGSGVQFCTQYGALCRGAGAWYDTDTILNTTAGPGGTGPGWNAATNVPAIADNTGANGYFWYVTTGATRNLGSGNIVMDIGGVLIHNGINYVYYPPVWSDGSPDNSQSNKPKFYDWYDYVDNTGLGVNMQASIAMWHSGQIDIENPTFEGQPMQRKFLVDINNMRASTTKDLGRMFGTWPETTGASRAGIRVKSDGGLFRIGGVFPQGDISQMPVLYENSNISQNSGISRNIIRDIQYNFGWKFRNRGIQRWNIKTTQLNDTANVFGATNWASDFGGTIPTAPWVVYENS